VSGSSGNSACTRPTNGHARRRTPAAGRRGTARSLRCWRGRTCSRCSVDTNEPPRVKALLDLRLFLVSAEQILHAAREQVIGDRRDFFGFSPRRFQLGEFAFKCAPLCLYTRRASEPLRSRCP
jgi:hypothetical protein